MGDITYFYNVSHWSPAPCWARRRTSRGNGRESAMTTEPVGHGVRRMCIAFDLERYSGGSDAAQVEKQREMTSLVMQACERGALERAHWLKQEQGDGELALLPPGIDEARVITALWREFREGL